MSQITQQFIDNINLLHSSPYSLDEMIREEKITRIILNREFKEYREWDWECFQLVLDNSLFDGSFEILKDCIESRVKEIKEFREREQEENKKRQEEELKAAAQKYQEKQEMEAYLRVREKIRNGLIEENVK